MTQFKNFFVSASPNSQCCYSNSDYFYYREERKRKKTTVNQLRDNCKKPLGANDICKVWHPNVYSYHAYWSKHFSFVVSSRGVFNSIKMEVSIMKGTKVWIVQYMLH